MEKMTGRCPWADSFDAGLNDADRSDEMSQFVGVTRRAASNCRALRTMPALERERVWGRER